MPVQLKTTVFDDLCAKPYYKSYTLPNTPFYIKPVWSSTAERIKYSQYQILWNFGDGTTFTGPSAYHFYKYPGTYNVTATFFDLSGGSYTENNSTDNKALSLTAINAMPDVVVFDNLLPGSTFGVYTLPAGERSKPLSVRRYNSWQSDDVLYQKNYTINLYASGSNSAYYSPEEYYKNKWAHLKNFHTFLETSLNAEGYQENKVITSTTTNSVSIYAVPYKLPFDNGVYLTFTCLNTGGNSAFCGTSGNISNGKTIHFIDQTPSNVNVNSLVFLYASPDPLNYVDAGLVNNNYFSEKIVPDLGYINLPWNTQFFKSIFNPAEKLEITSNGITTEGVSQTLGPLSGQELHSFSIYPIKWTNSNISFVVTFKDEKEFTTKCYPPITGFRTDGQDPTELNTVSLSLYKFVDIDPFEPVVLSSVRVDEAVFTENNTIPEFNSTYFAGILNVPVESKVAVICAAALIKDDPNLVINTTYGFAAQPGQKTLKRLSKRPIFENCNYDDISFSYDTNVDTFNVTTSGSVPISLAPLETFFSGNQDRIWVADPDTDRISVFTRDGAYITQISLSGAPIYTSPTTSPRIVSLLAGLECATPSSIAIDKTGNAWVTLMDVVSTIKISNDSLCVVRSAYPDLRNVEYFEGSLYTSLSAKLSGFVGENSLIPAAVDTTTTNDLFVSYSHPVSGFIFKYSSEGAILTSIPVTPLHSIQEIVVDKYDNLWAVANNLTDTNSIDLKKDIVYKWDKNLNLISGFPKFVNGAVGSLTIDKAQSAWINVSFTNLARIDNLGNITYFTVGAPATFIYSQIRNMQYMGGIATDNEGFLWLLHNIDGKVYYFPILPAATQQPLSALEFGDLPDISEINNDGSRAYYNVFGDWTGSRWVNKYYDPAPPLPRIVRGSSNLFDILENKPVINKINENFDATSTFKSYILQESLFDKPDLLDNFIGQMLGTYNSQPETLGKTIYEKIANFVANNADIEECNIQALKSLYLQFGEEFKDFFTSSPPKFRRALDLLSINHKKLYGSPNLYSLNFGLSTDGYNIGANLGDIINIKTGTFIVGEPVVAYEKFSEKYKIINNTIIPETNGIPVVVGSTYPLSCLNYNWGWGLVTGSRAQSGLDIDPYYIFYKYRPKYSGGYKDGVIDFENELTTLVPTESSYSDWTKFGGGIDKVISHTLSDGLGLLKT